MTNDKRVTVYSTKTCPYCVKVKQWLADHTIEFDNVYVDADKKAMQRMIELSQQMSVPYTTVETVDGGINSVIGFDEERLKQALGIQ